MRVLFVCSGNTCRSPMAEGLFRKKIKSTALSGAIECDSAGICTMCGDTASENAVLCCKKYGIDITAHRSRSVNCEDIETTDLFFCMTLSHKEALKNAGVEEECIYIPQNPITDPFGGNIYIYEKCFLQLEKEIDIFIDKLFSVPIVTVMKEEHLSQLARIESECFSHPWSENSLREELNNENARFYVVLFNGAVAGYAGMHFVCGEGYIDNIAVDKKFRRKGLASLLLSSLRKRAEAENGIFITLEVRASNEPAKALYEKFGFTERGVRKNFYEDPKEDAVIYTLDI